MYGLKNTVQLIGKVHHSPEIHTTESGKKCVQMYLCTDEVSRDSKGAKIIEKHYHRLIGWGAITALSEASVKEGCYILVNGLLLSRITSGQNGDKSIVCEVLIKELMILTSTVMS